jgi:CTP synthase
VQYARENNIPYFGICLGMQVACIEFARNVVGLKKANSSEFDSNTPHPVIDLMESQKAVIHKGATMRLGAYPCSLEKDSLAQQIYGEKEISERHRHRFEFNNAYRERFAQKGFSFSGLSPDGSLVEIIENSKHPYFICCQFHPEFKSRPMAPHPLFEAFIAQALAFSRRERWEGLKKAQLPKKTSGSFVKSKKLLKGASPASSASSRKKG